LHGASQFILRPDLNVNPAKFTMVMGIKGPWSNKPESLEKDAIAVYSEGVRLTTHRRPPPLPMVRIVYYDRTKYLKLTPQAKRSNKKRHPVSDYMIK